MRDADSRGAQPPQTFEARLCKRRWRFWIAFCLGNLGVALVVGLLSWWMGGPKVGAEPLLKTAPQFIVLSLVVVFAAYLRQVSIGAIELRNKIVSGELWNYPPDRGYAFVQDKIKALEETADTLSVVGPLLIWLAIFAAVRIALDGISKFALAWYWIPELLVWSDLGIAIWLCGIFAALGFFHFRARREDDRIRREADRIETDLLREHVARMRARQETVGSAQPPPKTYVVRTNTLGTTAIVYFLLGILFGFAARGPRT